MGGKDARAGFWFQDAKALTRLLDDAIERRRRSLRGLDPNPELRVRVESPVLLTVPDEQPEANALPNDDDAPLWDGTFARGDEIIVDECKLGGAKRDDRVTFYRRLRATAASPSVPIHRVAPQLTVGRDTVSDPSAWRQLATASQSVAPADGPISRVDSPEKLAAEALYYLTTARPVWTRKPRSNATELTVPETPPLSLADSRALLSRFLFDDSTTLPELEANLSAQLAAIDAHFAIDSLTDQLRGWVDRKARTTGTVPELTSSSVAAELDLAARYLSVAPAAEALWHRLRRANPPDITSAIALQPWRDVQPHLEHVLGVQGRRRIVFTSAGGVGKSFLLGALHEETSGVRLWIDTTAPLADLEDAITAGAWAVNRDATSLSIFVDAVDLQPDVVLGAIHRALEGCASVHVFVGMRHTTWAEIQAKSSAWQAVHLQRWTGDRVQELAQGQRRAPLSPDLVDLLRTPLLLDLFLRTFGTTEPVPASLGTRHGVLRAYFERRVLPEASFADERRRVLDAGVAAVLANRTAWRDGCDAARQLVSEGVLTSTLGELRFRHALLRDFATAIQLVPRCAPDIARDLQGVTSPIIRNELLRGLLEAVLDPEPLLRGPAIADIVRSCAQLSLAPGIALGTTDAPTGRLLETIATIEDGAVLRAAVKQAQVVDNRAWLHAPVEVGSARPRWLGHVQVEAMSILAEFALESGDSCAEKLALVLRSWTEGQCVGDQLPWPILSIGRLLSRVAPEDETLAWYAHLDLGPQPWLHPFLEQLRDIAATDTATDAALWVVIDKFLLSDPAILHRGNATWEIAHLFLQDHKGTYGLLRTRTRIAIDLLFALSVLQEEDEKRQRHERLQKHIAAFQEWLASAVPDAVEPDPDEERLRLEPVLSKEDALGGLVDDVPSTEGGRPGEIGAMMDEIASRASEDDEIAAHLVRAAIASRSIHARTIALQLPRSRTIDDAVVDILRDHRMYHVYYGSHALWQAIHERWSEMDEATRLAVQTNIVERARSPFLDVASVGSLASAIPREVLPAALGPYVELLERSGRSTEPPRPSRVRSTHSGSHNDEDDESITQDAPEEIARRWRQLRDLAAAAPELRTQTVVVLRSLVMAGELELAPAWVWETIRMIMSREVRERDRDIGSEDASALFDVVLATAEQKAARSEASFWGTLIDIADNCTMAVGKMTVDPMRARLMTEVSQAAGERAENPEHAMQAILWVNAASWFVNSSGQALFESWFREHLRSEALLDALHLLPGLIGPERLALLCHVLETPGRLGTDSEELRRFPDAVGKMVAPWALWWEQSDARDIFERWCSGPRTGALGEATAWRELLGGFGWGVQNGLRVVEDNPKTRAALERLVPLLSRAWDAWLAVLDDGDGSLSLSIVMPLGDEFSSLLIPPSGAWSIILRPLLLRIVLEGGRGDIGALQHVEWTNVDPDTLDTVADATVRRADSELAERPGTDWMVTSLTVILERLGSNPSLNRALAEQVLGCLHRLGAVAPRAVSVARDVERAIRARDR